MASERVHDLLDYYRWFKITPESTLPQIQEAAEVLKKQMLAAGHDRGSPVMPAVCIPYYTIHCRVSLLITAIDQYGYGYTARHALGP